MAEMPESRPEGNRRNRREYGKGVPSVTARRDHYNPKQMLLMEAVVERENMKRAYDRVMANKGSAGIDRMEVEELMPYLKEQWAAIRTLLLTGQYQPKPVRAAEIPKPGGSGMRRLGIPTVVDRLIQQALHQVLTPIFDPHFSKRSYGFRPGRNAQQAVEQACGYVAGGKRWVVDLDLEKFFDRVNHDILIDRLRKRIDDAGIIRLIRAYLNSGIMSDGGVQERYQGTPQGGPLSPLLSNILLDDLDRELEQRGHRFARYADDCNIYVRSQRAGERVMAGIEQLLAKCLKLKVNKAKSAVAKPRVRKFLGFSFTGGKQPRRRIAPQAIDRFKARVRELTRRSGGKSLSQVAKELSRYLIGWRAYFGFCETPSVLRKLDQWIRRRLCAIVWKQWKAGRTRFRKLRRRGVDPALAAKTAGSPKGPWRLANSQALKTALPKAFFRSLGVATLEPQRVA